MLAWLELVDLGQRREQYEEVGVEGVRCEAGKVTKSRKVGSEGVNRKGISVEGDLTPLAMCLSMLMTRYRD